MSRVAAIIIVALSAFSLSEGARLVKRDAFAADLLKPLFDALKPKSIVPTDADLSDDTNGDSGANAIYCSLCMFLAEFLKVEVRENRNMEELAVMVCEQNYGTRNQCQGFVNAQLSSLFAVLNATEDLRTDDLCASLTNCLSSAEITWNVNFPENDIVRKPKDAEELHRKGRSEDKGLKILHITDIHVDPDYEGETTGECFLNICCKARSSRPGRNARETDNADTINEQPREFRKLGPWGDYYACGTPWRTVRQLLCEHINQTHHDADVIFWTGDIPGHASWFQSREKNLETIRQAMDLLHECLPDIPVVPAIGNHEAYPINEFRTGEGTTWLYDELMKMWSKWLPEDAIRQASKGGFYTVPIRAGLRAIVLNTNYCYKYNWWNHANITDPEDQLLWFSVELEKATAANDSVYIVSHISPGSQACLPTWGHHYFQLLNKYSDVIMAQFYGHEHTDTFQVFYSDTEDGRVRLPIGIGFIGPSVTPINGLNPGYRVYKTAPNSETISDIQTYYFDMNEANKGNKTRGPQWKLLYSTSEDFGFQPTSFWDWDYAVRKLRENDDLFQRFYMYSSRRSSVLPKCGQKCRREALCAMEALDKTTPSRCKAKPPVPSTKNPFSDDYVSPATGGAEVIFDDEE